MKIPEAALQRGIDANLGHGPDSPAFSVATRLDIGELRGKRKHSSPNGFADS